MSIRRGSNAPPARHAVERQDLRRDFERILHHDAHGDEQAVGPPIDFDFFMLRAASALGSIHDRQANRLAGGNRLLLELRDGATASPFDARDVDRLAAGVEEFDRGFDGGERADDAEIERARAGDEAAAFNANSPATCSKKREGGRDQNS